MSDLIKRYEAAQIIAEAGAQTALQHFTNRDSLKIESKGSQDWVSNADREVELEVRRAISDQFPDDTIVGEEHDNKKGTSPYTWVIDPIDGTSSFLNAIPGWCVVLACVVDEKTVFGVIVDPIGRETFGACDGLDATLNGAPMKISDAKTLQDGSVAVGHSARFDHNLTLNFLSKFMAQDGIYYRIGSGALMLAYVASGRLLAYVEPHMYAWDCLAGLYMIERAGGQVQPFETATMLSSGGRVVAAAPGVYANIIEMTDASFG